MTDLSIVIPSCSEMFLAKTIENILENIKGNTEIIAVLDGKWADPPVPDHSRVTLIYLPQRSGHRAATNAGVKISQAKYIMKVDAHCAFDKGFDRKMLEAFKETGDDVTMVPIMKNLHAFDWVCEDCGWRKYQGPTPEKCGQCGGSRVKRDILWQGKPSPNSTSYRFDSDLHFQYFGDFKKRPRGQGEFTETMSLQGSAFMCTREKYWELGLCDETWGFWGQQGTEVACKTWLSGGRVVCNQKTWYAHMFRTQGGDFGFPYSLGGTGMVRQLSRDIFFNNKWEKQVRPFSWLLERFWPVPGWAEKDLQKQKEREKANWSVKQEPTKGIIFYTDNQLPLKIAYACQKQLKKVGLPIVSASLKPMAFGDKNVTLPLKRSYLTMFKQILAALEASDADIIFFCEHDCLYSKEHFEFTPPRGDLFYYDINVWKVDAKTGHSLHYDCKQLSGLCAYRDLAINHYKEKVRRVEAEGYSTRMGFEPGTHSRAERIDDYGSDEWRSAVPIVDIRHGENLSPTRWRKDQFRNQRYTEGWVEAEEVPGWGRIAFDLE